MSIWAGKGLWSAESVGAPVGSVRKDVEATAAETRALVDVLGRDLTEADRRYCTLTVSAIRCPSVNIEAARARSEAREAAGISSAQEAMFLKLIGRRK